MGKISTTKLTRQDAESRLADYLRERDTVSLATLLPAAVYRVAALFWVVNYGHTLLQPLITVLGR
jgi:hypothetical protein